MSRSGSTTSTSSGSSSIPSGTTSPSISSSPLGSHLETPRYPSRSKASHPVGFYSDHPSHVSIQSPVPVQEPALESKKEEETSEDDNEDEEETVVRPPQSTIPKRNREMVHESECKEGNRKRQRVHPQSKEEKQDLEEKEDTKWDSIHPNWDAWYTATSLRHYMMHDTLEDWLERYYEKKGICHRGHDTGDKVSYSKHHPFLDLLFRKGNEFEADIWTRIQARFPGQTVQIAQSCQARDVSKVKQTIQAMKSGIPIIYQGILWNPENQTYGSPDLMVRSDWINRLITDKMISPEEEHHPSIFGPYHYRVIDIKWTTLNLLSDGFSLCNSSKFRAYKAQLYIYNQAISAIQQYQCPEAYILGRQYHYTSKKQTFSGCSPFDRMGRISFFDRDTDIAYQVSCALKWLYAVRHEGHTWHLLPTPSREELYPNMVSKNDLPWHPVKQYYAHQLEELTLLWFCGPDKRRIGHSNGVYRLSDPKCCSSALGITGAIQAPTVDAILAINRSKTDLIRPKKITTDWIGWKRIPKLDLYVDFEYINNICYEGPDPYFSGEDTPRYTYLIGVLYVVDGVAKYQPFVLKQMTEADEREMVDNFVTFVMDLQTTYHCTPNVYHWGRAEQSTFRKLNEKHQGRWTGQKIKWVDMLKEIFKNKSQPIAIKGAWKYGIKEIAGAMFRNKMISNIWDSTCSNGLHAMTQGYECYKTAKESGVEITDLPSMKDLVRYNEIDCKVMLEILSYLRTHLC